MSGHQDESINDWKEQYYLEITTKLLDSKRNFGLTDILPTMKMIESDSNFIEKKLSILLQITYAEKIDKHELSKFLALLPYFIFSSNKNDIIISDEHSLEINCNYNEVDETFKKVCLLKQKLLAPSMKQNQARSAVELISELSKVCLRIRKPTVIKSFSKLYGFDWNTRDRFDFYHLYESLILTTYKICQHDYELEWRDGYAIPDTRKISEHFQSYIIHPLFDFFFKYYDKFIAGRTVKYYIQEDDIPPIEGIRGVNDIVLYYYSNNNTYKNFVVFIFKEYWKFDNISLFKKNGVKYSKAKFKKNDEYKDIMREVCYNFIKYGVKYVVLSCGIKTYLFKLEMESLKGNNISELTDIPISYTFFSVRDDIPLTTAISSIILELSKLPQSKLNLSLKEKTLLVKIFEKTAYSIEPPSNPNKRRKIKKFEVIRYFCDAPLLCEKNLFFKLNKDSFIGKILQHEYIVNVYLVTKQQFLKCFDYPDPSSLPDKFVFKMRNTDRIDLYAENKDRCFNHFVDGCPTPIYLSDDRYEVETYALNSLNHGNANVPKLYSYGHFRFKPKGRKNKYGYPVDIKGVFILMEYIESNSFGIYDVLKLGNGDKRKMMYYNKAKKQLNKIHNHKPCSIIHNGIFPRNMIISKNEEVYLIDFDAAIIFEEKDFKRDSDALDRMFFPKRSHR